MKFMDRLSRLLGRRSKAQIDPEDDSVGRAEVPQIADGHLDDISAVTTSPVLHSLDSDKDTPLHQATRSGDLAFSYLLTRIAPNSRGWHLNGQEMADYPISESHLLVTKNLFSSDKSRHATTREKVNVETMRCPRTPETSHKTYGVGSQLAVQTNSRKKVLGSSSDTAPNESSCEDNACTNSIHPVVQLASQLLVEKVRITCPSCAACYEILRSHIPESGRDLECSDCGNVWFQVSGSYDGLTTSSAGNTDQYREIDPDSSIDCTDTVDTDISQREHGIQDLLEPSEIRQIIEARQEGMHEFIASKRFNARDPKGDTPLHLAARVGNLALCDLFIRSGADPDALNHERQTPAEVAHVEGHNLASQLLSSLVVNSQEIVSLDEASNAEVTSEVAQNVAAQPFAEPEQRPSSKISDTAAALTQLDDLDDLLSFEAEEEPEELFGGSPSEKVSGTFVAIVSSSLVVSEDGDWELDLSAAPIAGEGIVSSAAVAADHGAESDFLQVRNRGRQSVKRAVVQTGTRMSIDPDLCFIWAEEILAKGRCSLDDVDHLIAHCEGNGDLEELRINLQRNVEAAGFDLDQATKHDAELWDAISDTSSDELADAIEAGLSRRTRLPGSQRFVMDKSDELQLLEPMMRAKQELQLGILASETAVETILNVIDSIRDGSRDSGSVSLRAIVPSRPGHADTSEVMAAADALRSWHTTGRVMDGKRRREALAALEALDLSLAFHKELVRRLEQFPACQAEASQLEAEIVVSESATEHLICEHLPYVRRFASRNVEEGEDPEDVFQVAFMGLQRSTRRFDPERGYRFLIYATYWMRQAIMRWRADEGAAIRIPVHRNEKIAKLDRALDRLDVRVSGAISDLELAVELEWAIDEVRQFRGIPREAEYPASLDDWDNLLPEPSEVDVFDQAETERIVTDALADLPERQADVIRMRFGIGRDFDMTLEEIGQIYGVTRERIRQIEAKGLDRLSHPGRKRRLQELLGM